jgi:hypothetical protein
MSNLNIKKSPVHCLTEMSARQCRNPGFVRGANAAVLEQHGLAPPDPGNEMRGCTISAIADNCLVREGIRYNERTPFDVTALYTESDFPAVMNAIAQSAVMAGWDAGPSIWQRFCGSVNLRSLRPEQRVVVGGFGLFAKIPEGQAIAAQDIPGYSTVASAERYGIGFGLTEEAVRNNDLGQLISAGRAIGFAGAASIEAASCAVLNANPVLSDGGTLFNLTAVDGHGGHANKALVDTAISATAIALGKSAMRRQVAPIKHGRPLNIRPRFIIAAAEQEEEAWTAAGLPNGFGEAGSDLERYLLQSGRCELMTTPYLPGPAWFLAADPLVAPLVNIGFLNGKREPSLSSRINFHDNIEFVARLDFGAVPGDWRGGYLNGGA